MLGRLLLAIPLSMALTIGVQTAPASAITRAEVISRAHVWVKRRVRYSQSGYYRGYRRDCSGMVSMAWNLKKSYTSSTIRSAARRISKGQLQPGDAVRYPGHVAVFAGWKNKRKGTYYVMEQSGQGKPAAKRVKKWKRGSQALRYRGIQDNPVLVASAAAPPAAVAAATTAVSAAAATAAQVPIASVEVSLPVLP
jgi:hypothetical protein